MTHSPVAVTISRQIGSGGAYLGFKIAKKLGYLYLNNEILRKAAEEFRMQEENLVEQDERVSSFWSRFIQVWGYPYPDLYVPPAVYFPTDTEFFNVESKIIREAARTHSVVVIGRCGTKVLEDHPRHVSVFLHAPVKFRLGRMKKYFSLTESEALAKIQSSDRDRAFYHETFAEGSWTDATNYTFCFNTEKTGFEMGEKILVDYIQEKFLTEIRDQD